MRILIVIPYLDPTYGGTSKVVAEVVQSLAFLGVSVDLITTNASGVNSLDVPLNIWITREGYRVRYFPSWHRNDFIISPSLTSWLFNHVADYNLVHTHTMFAPLISLAHRACQIHNVPYVMTPHGMLEPWALAYKAWKKRFYFTMFEKQDLQTASVIQVLANSEAEHIKSLGFQHSIVVPNGIHCHEFEILPEAEIFYQQFPHTRNKTLILFLGRIDPKKGLDLLAPAFAKVHHQFPHTHIVVAGPDNIGFLPTVENYFAESLSLNAVTFTGMLTDDLKYAAFSAASVYVAASYSEGFSMSILEGMASGLPCIITTGCNFPEAAKNEVAYVVETNTSAIATALIKCLSNSQQAKLMGMKARDFIFQNYTWEQAAKKLLHTYKEIINK